MKSRAFRYVAIVAGSMALGAAGILIAQDKKEAPADPAVDPGKVVITMANLKVTAGEFNAFVRSLPPEVQNLNKGQGKKNLAEEFIRLKLLSNEAKQRKLDESDRFKEQMAIMRDNVLVGLLLGNIQDQLISPDDVQKYYNENQAKYERVVARHILVAAGGDSGVTEEQAKAKADAIRKQLDDKGDNFADIAKKESSDPGTKDEGGKLQPFTRGVMVPEFEKAAFELPVGKISDPIKTQFGYHIIQVTQREIPPLDQLKEGIADELRQDRFEDMYADLKKQASPKLDDEFFPEEQASQMPPK